MANIGMRAKEHFVCNNRLVLRIINRCNVVASKKSSMANPITIRLVYANAIDVIIAAMLNNGSNDFIVERGNAKECIILSVNALRSFADVNE